MLRFIFKFLLCLPVLLAFSVAESGPVTDAADSPPDLQLELTVKGLEGEKGLLQVALFDTEEDYNENRALQTRSVPITGASHRLVFDGLPTGRYAVKLFVDEDRDDTLDTNAFGYPSEEFAFSNNAEALLGQPDWAAANFIVSDENRTTSRQIVLD